MELTTDYYWLVFSQLDLSAEQRSVVYRTMHQRSLNLAEAFQLPTKELAAACAKAKVPEFQLITDQFASYKKLYQQLPKDMTLLNLRHPSYPARLKKYLRASAPPVLFVRGNIGLLSNPLITFLDTPNEELRMAKLSELTAMVTEAGWQCGSPFYSINTRAVAEYTLEQEGTMTFLFPHGLSHFLLNQASSSYGSERNSVCLSSFLPNAPQTPARILEAQTLICLLSNLVVTLDNMQLSQSIFTKIKEAEIPVLTDPSPAQLLELLQKLS